MLMVPGDDEPEDPAKIRKTALERLKLEPVPFTRSSMRMLLEFLLESRT